MQPASLLLDIHSSFIKVGHLGLPDIFFDEFFYLLQFLGTKFSCRLQRPLRQWLIEQVGKDFATSLTGKEMLFVQIDQQTFDPSPIACPGWHRLRKAAKILLMAMETLFCRNSMLDDLQAQGRQLKDLPALRAKLGGGIKERATTTSTLHGEVNELAIRGINQSQGLALMSALSAGFLGTGLSQGTSLFGKAITGRWFAGVATIVARRSSSSFTRAVKESISACCC